MNSTKMVDVNGSDGFRLSFDLDEKELYLEWVCMLLAYWYIGSAYAVDFNCSEPTGRWKNAYELVQGEDMYYIWVH